MILPTPQVIELEAWLDWLDLPRAKKNLRREVADAVLFSQIIHHYKPHWVDLHNYTPCTGREEKKKNWRLLSLRVLQKRLGIYLTDGDIEDLVDGQSDLAELLLYLLKQRLDTQDDPHEFWRNPGRSRHSPMTYPSKIHTTRSSSPTVRDYLWRPPYVSWKSSGRTLSDDTRAPSKANGTSREPFLTFPKHSTPLHPMPWTSHLTTSLNPNEPSETFPSRLWETVLSPQDFHEWQLLKKNDIGMYRVSTTKRKDFHSLPDSETTTRVEKLIQQIQLQQEKIKSLEELVKLKDIKLDAYLCMPS